MTLGLCLGGIDVRTVAAMGYLCGRSSGRRTGDAELITCGGEDVT